MQSGILTDDFSRERVERMDADDWRRRNPEFREPLLSRNLALRDALRPIASRHGVLVSAVAIGWVLSWPGVSGAIVGARSPQQVDGWIAAGNLALTQEDLEEISGALVRTEAGVGPTHPARALQPTASSSGASPGGVLPAASPRFTWTRPGSSCTGYGT
jgi:aryl-alcohol dehydrogenase-like predicted oxidoreductase